ncbi:hypothetical protein AB1Y20_023222 [Prymnesium parvum]|uniref:TLC domain-containing protein n=1 Tax=Prymnesium parvum TaxID=97485 RepID=A0AB34JG28_PRYPA|eukprot:CAMPEP_0113249296 /NCGR_PEP_ID=MMETSP0008_2-20120614/10978_1 /TAXON_ID=97485 /ORGANISM="Prymnesium parvum" /LENGTH=275 /DNA_ID=CAMNT_0000097209 /DNA_START=17 /DNA_END=844 /DNA_ORIENTATION=- /assembly_acc=CAM_ASM_000153
MPSAQCGQSVPFMTTSAQDTELEIMLLVLRYAGAFFALWVVLAVLSRLVFLRFLPKSQDPRENSPLCVAQHLGACVKCLFVVPVSNYVLYLMYFGGSWSDDALIRKAAIGASAAGTIFVSFEVADVFVLLINRKLTAENIIHHSVHILISCLIRLNCEFTPEAILTTAFLTAQETSSIFLNVYLLLRRRGMDNHLLMKGAFACFALCFYIWRLGIGTYCTYFYLTHTSSLPHYMPNWQVVLMSSGLLIGNVLQWYWGAFVIRKRLTQQLYAKRQD